MNRFKEALKHNALNPKAVRTKEVYDQFCVIYKDEITYALKLAAKLEQEPTERMLDAGMANIISTNEVTFTELEIVFQAMLEQAKREIE